MVVYRNRQRNLCLVLSDDILIHIFFNCLGRRNGFRQILIGVGLIHFFADDIIAKLNTIVADINSRSGNQPLDLRLILAAKGASDIGFTAFFCHERYTLSVNYLWVMTLSIRP